MALALSAIAKAQTPENKGNQADASWRRNSQHQHTNKKPGLLLKCYLYPIVLTVSSSSIKCVAAYIKSLR